MAANSIIGGLAAKGLPGIGRVIGGWLVGAGFGQRCNTVIYYKDRIQ